MTFRVRGPTATARSLGSGATRQQLGLKLRAAVGCNLVYVMWRLAPPARLEASIKRNLGASHHAQCGTRGYVTVRPGMSQRPPLIAPGEPHTLRAEIDHHGSADVRRGA